jgi:hypothetical protein
MATCQIPREKLEKYFDTFSRHFLRDETTDVVDVEFLSPDLGDQPVSTDAHLVGITYDPKSNALDVVLESGDHRVFSPREVWVDEEPDGFVRAIEAVRADGTKEVIRVKRLGLTRRE